MASKVSLPEGFHDLGEEYKKIEASILPKIDSEDNGVHYPSLYFTGKGELKNLPESGTALIHFTKVMEREEEIVRNGKKEEHYSVELQIHGIKPEQSDETSVEESKEPSDEDAIEQGLEAASETQDTD